jgi:hypothetical protein
MSTQQGSQPTNLKALEGELGVVKSDLLAKKASTSDDGDASDSKHNYFIEQEVKAAGLAFEAIHKESEAINDLKSRLEETKAALSNDVMNSHRNLAETLENARGGKTTHTEHDVFLLRKKVEGAELQLELAHQKVQQISFFEVELQEATDELFSVLNMQEERCIQRIIQAKAAEDEQPSDPHGKSLYKSILSSYSSVNRILSESIVQLGQERDKLKRELVIIKSNEEVHSKSSQLVYKLENEIRQLKSELGRAHGAGNNEFSIRAKTAREPGDLDMDEDEDSYGFEDEGPDLVSEALMASAVTTAPPPHIIVEVGQGDFEFDDDSKDDARFRSPDTKKCVDDMQPPDLEDVAILSPEYEQMMIDQMKHEEELEEYAVHVLTLKENISVLQNENSSLQAKVAAIPEEGEMAMNIKKLEEKAEKWEKLYDECAGERESQISSLKGELEASKAYVVTLQRSEREIATSSMKEVERLKTKVQTYKENLKAIQRESPTPSRDGDKEETEMLQKEVEMLRLSMEKVSTQAGKEMLQMQRIIAALETDKQKKEETIESLRHLLKEEKLERERQLEREKHASGKRLSDFPTIPTIYSYGS